MRLKKWLRRSAIAGGSLATFAGLAWIAFESADRAFPPPLPAKLAVSSEVTDRDGQLLRAYATPDGRWRLAVTLDQVDPQFVKMLVAYEDKRFFGHAGIDYLALGRAATQFAANGRIVSGGSTLSMQLARLIEPRENRSFSQKLRQIFRAIQIERRLSKQEILEHYLTLAPYGGNLEGVRAASLAWFGKEPKRLAGRARPRASAHGHRRPARQDGGRARVARRRSNHPPRIARTRRPRGRRGVAHPPL